MEREVEGGTWGSILIDSVAHSHKISKVNNIVQH